MSDKGKCKHGDFNLIEGCPQCIEERATRALEMADRVLGGDTSAVEPLLKAVNLPSCIVKVQYYSKTTGELSAREYTYYSVDRLTVGDILTVPVRDTTGKAKVSAIDIPESEIASFKDKVKTIPAGSIVLKVLDLPAGGLAEAAQAAGAEVKVVEMATTLDTKINLCDTCSQEQPICLHDPEKTSYGDGVGNDNVIECDGFAPVETAKVLKLGEDIEVHGYYEESRRLLAYAARRVITTLEDNKAANDDLAIISKHKKAMEAKRKEYLDPLKAQSDAIRDTYNYLMSPILEAEKITKGKMLAYDAEQRRIRQEQEEVNRLRLEAAQKEAALNNGEISESVNLVEVAPEAPRRVSTDMGTSGQRDNWKYELVDFASVPDEYKMINVGVLTPAVKSFKDKRTIPGIRIYNEPIIATRAR